MAEGAKGDAGGVVYHYFWGAEVGDCFFEGGGEGGVVGYVCGVGVDFGGGGGGGDEG